MSPTTRRARTCAAVGLTALLLPVAIVTTPALAASASGDFGVYANPGDAVTIDFPYQAEQYSWVVPYGVTEITVELAAASGQSRAGSGEFTPQGGVGGHAIVTVPVESGETLFMRLGASVPGPSERFGGDGGGGSALARASELLLVVGGGGGNYACFPELGCGTGGAGGLSLTSGSVNGQDSGWSDDALAGLDPTSVGGGATPDGPGAPGESEGLAIVDGQVVDRQSEGRSPETPPAAAAVESGVLRLSPAGAPSNDFSATGGTGAFTGGTGGVTTLVSQFPQLTVRTNGAGGGGGSGYLAPGVEVVELRDNVGDGFASITYTVPEPDVVDAPAPTLALGATSVQAGASLTLTGSGFDPERDYPVILNSDPVLLGTATTDVRGAFSATLLVPTTVPPGEHVITVGDASIPITVTAADAPLAADGTGDVTAFAAAPELPPTGADPLAASILGALAVALLATGAAAIRASRQSLHHRQPSPVRQPFPARRAATRVR